MVEIETKKINYSETKEIVCYCVNNEGCKILDIGSDKAPKCAQMFANWFENSEVTHYRKNKKELSEKNKRRFQKSNLTIICDNDKQITLKPNHDIATGIFSMHPLDDPYEAIQIAYDYLTPDGKFLLWDYNIKNLPPKLQEPEMFSKYIFTTENECAFLGLKNGEPYIHKKIQPEKNCIQNHMDYGLEDFREIAKNVGFKELRIFQDQVNTPYGNFSKQFILIAEK